MLWPWPAALVYGGYCLLERALRMMYWSRHIPSDVRATVLSFGSQADAAGQIAGGPVFGWIASTHSTALALVAAGACLLPGVPLLLRALRGNRARPSAP